MNQNDRDRYFWRVGHVWGEDNRATRALHARKKVVERRTALFAAAFLVTVFLLFLQR